jgi:hypothetical protein
MASAKRNYTLVAAVILLLSVILLLLFKERVENLWNKLRRSKAKIKPRAEGEGKINFLKATRISLSQKEEEEEIRKYNEKHRRINIMQRRIAELRETKVVPFLRAACGKTASIMGSIAGGMMGLMKDGMDCLSWLLSPMRMTSEYAVRKIRQVRNSEDMKKTRIHIGERMDQIKSTSTGRMIGEYICGEKNLMKKGLYNSPLSLVTLLNAATGICAWYTLSYLRGWFVPA